METTEQKTARNSRVAARYDELYAAGKHGHYETVFRVVREEVERERERLLAGYREIAAATDPQMRDGDLARDIAERMLGA